MQNFKVVSGQWPVASKETVVTGHWLLAAGLLCLLAPAILMIFLYAPAESTMGEVQRILYLHVSLAWCGLAGCLTMAICGVLYLIRRDLRWDHWSQAGAEVGWLCSTLTLATGSLWARQAWGVWWTWDPRLTFFLVLWLVFAGIFVVRAGLEDPQRRRSRQCGSGPFGRRRRSFDRHGHALVSWPPPGCPGDGSAHASHAAGCRG